MKKHSNEYLNFLQECKSQISNYPLDLEWKKLSDEWLYKAFKKKYMYNFESLGRPIIQTPVDMIAIQEIIWEIKPDLIIETGIAHGGSFRLFHSSPASSTKRSAATQFQPIRGSDRCRAMVGPVALAHLCFFLQATSAAFSNACRSDS